jgi:DNA adenine methylase
MSALTPPLPYFGGKQRIAPQIAAVLPAHGHYVEPYCGGLSVLMAKRPSTIETVNDIDGDLMTFWRVLRDQPIELMQLCALTPQSRAEHQASFRRDDGPGDLELARRVWVSLTQGRTGTLLKTGWRHHVDPNGTTMGMPAYARGYLARMAPAAERLAMVSLECKPALDMIDKYGSCPDVLLYVDPPYLGSTRNGRGYKHEMPNETEHRELAEALTTARAAVVLSGYASTLYDELFTDWNRIEIDASTGQGSVWKERTEVLWSNRDIDTPALFEGAS